MTPGLTIMKTHILCNQTTGHLLATALFFSATTQTLQAQTVNGEGTVTISGDLKTWHKVTLTQAGPFARESDTEPNPFTDYRMSVAFWHESGSPTHVVPGYFAADGNAANSSADQGNQWRAHLSPDKPGTWRYQITFTQGKNAALSTKTSGDYLNPYHGKSGSFTVTKSDKTGSDFRGRGRLEYVNQRYLRFAGSGEYFLKAGPDAPETLLAYSDFDNTQALKDNVPLKTWEPHVRDWRSGDPTWKGGKGKGLIGALNYLASKGCNSFSFLPYNVGGDGRNVWPFVKPDDKLHYDCSKLDQWGIIFDHAQSLGLYLHFKLQENEMDDHRQGHKRKPGEVPAALDAGKLGVERKLYCRELIARFGHALALNWNLGEENTQTTEEQQDMAQYLLDMDTYDHNIIVHTFPDDQDKVYTPLLGKDSSFTGASLQNNWNHTHQRTIQWVIASTKAGKPWVVANDEQGPANQGTPPDPGYEGHNEKGTEGAIKHDLHDIRKYTLWGNLMAGGAGVEYYFGYQLAQNDLICEDFRSRDRSWDYCRIALDFFKNEEIPFWKMQPSDRLVDNPDHENSRYCFAGEGEIYLIYLPEGGTCELDLSGVDGRYRIRWFNPREGGRLKRGSARSVRGGDSVSIGNPPSDLDQDWLAVIQKR
ncbi:MAG: hypothetical protein M2R45_02865 [Verrucomicrobia subdivision 3 bacterium]|nr:hypothetical protein [Limisphaerales bacterium]MCS1414717.1 hypothetical protein [Limisphaerales bacterium]